MPAFCDPLRREALLFFRTRHVALRPRISNPQTTRPALSIPERTRRPRAVTAGAAGSAAPNSTDLTRSRQPISRAQASLYSSMCFGPSPRLVDRLHQLARRHRVSAGCRPVGTRAEEASNTFVFFSQAAPTKSPPSQHLSPSPAVLCRVYSNIDCVCSPQVREQGGLKGYQRLVHAYFGVDFPLFSAGTAGADSCHWGSLCWKYDMGVSCVCPACDIFGRGEPRIPRSEAL